jgi:hypothetical protein
MRYNTDTLRDFRIKLMEFDTPTIYCDMDGVLADFIKFTTKILGKPFKDQYWGELPKDIFFQLDPMSDAHRLWSFIVKFDPRILTAHPKPGRGPVSDQAPDDKKRWMMKHFRWPASKIFPVLRADKSRFAKDGRDGRPNLLIDDHIKNCIDFRNRGGIAVVHTSANNTIKELKAIGYK